MRFTFYILISLLIISCTKRLDEQNKDINFSVKAKVINAFDSVYWNNIKRKTFNIEVTLINKSNKPTKFWIMNCSWQKNFIFNYPTVNYERIDCRSNFPIQQTLKGNDSIVFRGFISRNDTLFNNFPLIKNTNFGFLYIDSLKEDLDLHLITLDRSRQKIFWSNPLYLFDEK